ncbi:hypothetical protein [Pseudanabaena sp. PCC 6802]|uniref:hypothetical protein n=1 Tax=Pseudanabaena sp. PCC 6802 TaxID=118173 RepID=UPI00034D1F1E|nr:hypothetical protein [Pseudanabaena sp. PCC 6802]
MKKLLLPGDPGFNAILQSKLPASDIPLDERNYIANEAGMLEAVNAKSFLEYAYDSYGGWDTDEDEEDDEWISLEEAEEYICQLKQDFHAFLSTGKT